MNKHCYKTILLALGMTLALGSCNDLEDNDYFKDSFVKNTNQEVSSTSVTVASYIQQRSDLSKMSALFQQEGLFEEMKNSGELHTVLVVTDESYVEPDAEIRTQTARSHITNISVSPSKLNDGDRLLMWHDKYVSISADSVAQTGNFIDHVKFNTSSLLEVIKAEDGFIYVISEMIYTPTSLQDFINDLDESQYGKFKNMVLSSGGKEFNIDGSKVIGVDNNGNTLYDTVWTYTNTFFDAKGFSLSSESLKATMLLFSDDVIKEALTEAKETLKFWGYDYKTQLLRNGSKDSVYVGYTSDKDLEDWFLKAAFFNKRYDAASFTPSMNPVKPTDNDVKSIYDIAWRTSVQELDLENPVELSNAIVYEVKKCHIPKHRLIYRLHEEFQYYAQCTADQKEEYFKCKNLVFSKIATNEVAPWTPLAGVWDPHGNSPLVMKVEDNTEANYSLDFTPLYRRVNAEGNYEVGVLMVPPGEYRMAMGFKQGNPDLTIQLLAVNVDGETPCADPIFQKLSDGSTNWHYDRGATLSNSLPEYYDKNDPRLTAGNKNPYYWTDGGPVYDVVTIPDLNGDGSALRLLIRMTGNNGKTAGNLTFNHWCLRPTVNNY